MPAKGQTDVDVRQDTGDDRNREGSSCPEEVEDPSRQALFVREEFHEGVQARLHDPAGRRQAKHEGGKLRQEGGVAD